MTQNRHVEATRKQVLPTSEPSRYQLLMFSFAYGCESYSGMPERALQSSFWPSLAPLGKLDRLDDHLHRASYKPTSRHLVIPGDVSGEIWNSTSSQVHVHSAQHVLLSLSSSMAAIGPGFVTFSSVHLYGISLKATLPRLLAPATLWHNDIYRTGRTGFGVDCSSYLLQVPRLFFTEISKYQL